jgi:outer membrane lipoprotein-sorting protein
MEQTVYLRYTSPSISRLTAPGSDDARQTDQLSGTGPIRRDPPLRQGARRLSRDNAGIERILQLARRAAAAAGLPVLLLLLLLLSACAVAPAPQLSATDVADIDRVTAYLNSIPRFEAHFVQFGSFGPDAGLIVLDRPAGHLRIDYADPAGRVMVIANGQVVIVDRGNGSTTTIPVSRTPLGMLLTPSVSLSGDITVASVLRQPGTIQVTLTKTDHPSRGSLTLTLTDAPLRLTAVTMSDAERRTLTMSLSGIDTTPRLTPDLFQPPALPSGS